MKKLIITIAITALLIGCSDKRDAQIKSLTERLDRLEYLHVELSEACRSNAVESADVDLKIWKSILEQNRAHKSQNEINEMLRDYINTVAKMK